MAKRRETTTISPQASSDPPPLKRIKATGNPAADQQQQTARFTPPTPTDPSHRPPPRTDDLPTSPPILPPELQHVQHLYGFATMSVTASSKIEKKVTALRAHMAQFSFLDLTAKPGVVVLHAKAAHASKLITVVEITKREIEKQRGGKWWQYSRMFAQIEELKAKRGNVGGGGTAPSLEDKKTKGLGTTLAAWEQEKTRASKLEVSNGTTDVGPADLTTHMDVDTGEEVGEEVKEEEMGEEEEAFETMTEPPKAAKETSGGPDGRKKIRAVPIMVIYMSMVPIPEFRALYTEQTNA